MSIIVKGSQGGTSYTPHPTEDNPYAAVCCDVQDLGYEETTYNGDKRIRYVIRIVFFCGEWTEPRDVEGVMKRFPMTVSKKFTASLHEKASLRAFAKSWRGSDFSPDEVNGGFDFERMVGAPALLQIGHFTYEGATYAGIDSIMRLPKGQQAPAIPAEYTRLKDREDWTGPAPHPQATDSPANHPAEEASGGMIDDDLPFARPDLLW